MRGGGGPAAARPASCCRPLGCAASAAFFVHSCCAHCCAAEHKSGLLGSTALAEAAAVMPGMVRRRSKPPPADDGGAALPQVSTSLTSLSSSTSAAAGSPLREVGFWSSRPEMEAGEGPGDYTCRPNPRQHVRRGWAETAEAKALLAYLRAGYIESYEMGYSFCRFGGRGAGRRQGVDRQKPGTSTGGDVGCYGCPTGPWRAMGCVALTDGEFVWPEGLVSLS
jgi:hypothetical protein